MKFRWERILTDHNIGRLECCTDVETFRAKVHGGWLVLNKCRANNNSPDKLFYDVRARQDTLVFVPDPKHEWKVEV